MSKTTGFIEYNSLCDKLLHVQFMSLRAPLIPKFMLTYKHLQNHPQHSWNTCTMLLSVESLPFQAYTSKTLMKTTYQFQKKVSHYLNNSAPHNNLQTQIEFHDENTCNILLNNARSFKKYFHAIKNNQIVLKQNITIFLESKLSQHDKSIDYQINNCIIIRADEKNTINRHRRIISYINSSVINNSIQNMSTKTIDTLYMNISHKNKHISIYAIYNSPKNTYTNLINHLLPKIDSEYLINKHILILRDFNIQQHTNDYLKLSSKLAKYNIKQHIHNYTTINNTTIDYVFTNMQINRINILYAHWSNHNIIQLQIDT